MADPRAALIARYQADQAERLRLLGARPVPRDPAADPVAQHLGGALGLDQPSLLDRMAQHQQLGAQRFAAGDRGPDRPGTPEFDLASDIASNFDFTGAIKAYHGSPHTFDAFDLSKIGTGEGAQAYGHGLYFAESPGVAQSYAEKFSGSRKGKVTLSGASDYSRPGAIDALDFTQGDVDAAIRHLNEFKGSPYSKQKGLQEDIDWLTKNRDEIEFHHAPGGFYTANLDVNHEDLLDWDLPLSQQPEKVREALKPFLADRTKRMVKNMMERDGAKATDDNIAKYQQKAKDSLFDIGGSELHAMMSVFLGGNDKVAATLRNAGIPGLRYLDAGSRDGGEGSRNIVLFDDRLAQILERNGQPVKRPEASPLESWLGPK